MSPVPPSPAVLVGAADVLRSISSAGQVYRLYPPGHPDRLQATGETLQAVRGLRTALGRPPVLFVTRHAFYLGNVLLPRESLTRYGLVEAFEGAGVEAVEFLSPTGEDVDWLVRTLAGESDLHAMPAAGGIAVNRIKPVVDQVEDTGTELRRGYAIGLEVLRHTADAVAADRPIDLEAAGRLVELLSKQIGHDSAQALLLSTVRSHHEQTYYHMLNVCLLSIALGYAVGLEPEQIVELGTGALLHDVGKVNVPTEILRHPGSLSPEQWAIIKQHPTDGAALIFSTGHSLMHPAAAIAFEHHSAYDLSGYPHLSGRLHPSLPARIVAVTDNFDAITTTRPYRKAEERRQALSIILTGAGRGLDPHVARAVARLLGLFPVGSFVRISDGSVGIVVRNHDRLLSRPTVRVLFDPRGDPCDPVERDLSETDGDGAFRWRVERSLDPAELQVDPTELVLEGTLTSPQSQAGSDGNALVHDPSPGEPVPSGYAGAERVAAG